MTREDAHIEIAELNNEITAWCKAKSEAKDALNEAFCNRFLDKAIQKKTRLNCFLEYGDGDRFSDEVIETARQYPIERLIDFNSNGYALAFCHADKTPSLSLWKGRNIATCFVCGEHFNPIDVLMRRDGYNFYDAVKQLIGD